MSSFAHRVGEIALMDGLVLLLFGFDRVRIERGAFLHPIFDRQMLCRIARLFECFGNDQRDRLTPVADGLRLLLRRFVGGALRSAGGQPGIVDHRDDTGHGERSVPVDRGHFAARDGRGDEHPFRAIID